MKPIVARMIRGNAHFLPMGDWLVHRGSGHRLRQRRRWQTKIYVCVKAPDYWPTVCRLLLSFCGSRFRWKFFFGSKSYCRPDKIVFYPSRINDLDALIPALRESLKGCRVHKLFHAASTAQMGLERRGADGLFVGADPQFLGESWRLYRTLCIAWLQLNTEHIETRPGGVPRWMSIMNLSCDHEGPESLQPPRLSTTKQNWLQIVGKLA